MPVEVSLLELVCVADARWVWPGDFAALMAKLEESPDDRVAWGAVADWCDEHDEPELAGAFRYVHRRESIEATRGGYGTWDLTGLPATIQNSEMAAVVKFTDVKTLAGAVARLALRLKKVAEDLE